MLNQPCLSLCALCLVPRVFVSRKKKLVFVFGWQTQLEVKKWREAEVIDVRHDEAGTEVWVSGLD